MISNTAESLVKVTALIRRGDKVLVARRRRAFMGSPWELPGGMVKEGETIEECLRRDLRQQLGIEVEVGKVLCTNHCVLNCQSAMDLFLCEANYISGEFCLREHEEVRWVTIAELNQFNMPDTDRTIIMGLFR